MSDRPLDAPTHADVDPSRRASSANGALRSLVAALGSVAVGLLVMLAAVAGFGYPPLIVARAFVASVLGSGDRLAAALVLACPLAIIGLAIAVSFRAGVWNIGGEGQYVLGALAAFLAAHAGLARTPVLGPIVLLVAGALGGAAWAALAALLKRYRGAPEILTTILLNFIAVQVVAIAVHGPLADPLSGDRDTTASIPAAAQLPQLIPTAGLHAGILVPIALAVVAWIALARTTPGFRLRVVGDNPIAARFVGIHADRVTARTLMLSGAIVGLAGAVELAGNTHYLTAAYDAGYGYTAIAVALLARLHPIAVLPAAAFFAALETGARGLQKLPDEAFRDFPTVLTYFAQGTVILVTVLLARMRISGATSP